MFSAWSVQSGYKEVFGNIKKHRVSCCRELGPVLEMAVEGNKKEMVRNELDCPKKASSVI
jgi:hypothetical protein